MGAEEQSSFGGPSGTYSELTTQAGRGVPAGSYGGCNTQKKIHLPQSIPKKGRSSGPT